MHMVPGTDSQPQPDIIRTDVDHENAQEMGKGTGPEKIKRFVGKY
jgi:hypothetical protein